MAPVQTPDKPSRASLVTRRATAAALLLTAAALIAVAARSSHARRTAQKIAMLSQGVSQAVLRKHEPKRAEALAASCALGTCPCALAALQAGLDVDANVHDLLDFTEGECKSDRRLPGFRAEVWVRERRPNGEAEAKRVLAKNMHDPYARYALALAQYQKGNAADSIIEAQTAAHDKRGPPAWILAGLLGYGFERFDYARDQFLAALREDPENVEATYNAALMAQRLGQYTWAREGYLRVLRLDPGNQDSRYNLVVLTHSVGAEDEAKHHLERFRALNPPHEAVQKLEAILAVPSEAPAPSGLPMTTPNAPPSDVPR